MASARWSVEADEVVRIDAWNGDGTIPVVVINDFEGSHVIGFVAHEVDRLDALIKDLQAAREFAFGKPDCVATASTTVDLRPLIASLKDLTLSRSEFARCEAALEMLGN